MNNIRIQAVGEIPAGKYGSVEVDGVAKCQGALYAQELEVDGALTCTDTLRSDRASVDGALKCGGRLDAGELDVDGAVTIRADAGVERLSVDGSLTVEGAVLECGSIECDGAIKARGRLSAQTLEVDGALAVEGGRLECTQIHCDGAIRCGGQVSADVVHVDGVISAEEIVGDEIVIHSAPSHGSFFSLGGLLFGGGSDRLAPSRAKLIEATTVELTGVQADTVNGTHVVIGPQCVIGRLDCNGTLSIHPEAQVGEITGEYTRE